jgi:hypothetical protein
LEGTPGLSLKESMHPEDSDRRSGQPLGETRRN